MKHKRVFLIVLDSFGIGELPDADRFGDKGSDTLSAVYSSGALKLPNMKKLGLFNIEGVRCGKPESFPIGVYGRAAERSIGKDTTIGHWEISGVVSEKPLPTYPNGVPTEILDELERRTGIGWLCNKTYSGTQVILDYAAEQKKTGKMIIYTSADSVFQVAADMSVFTLDQLHAYCECARSLLVGDHAVGRVIARPFTGEYPNYVRTSDRHDYSLEAPSETLLDLLSHNEYRVISIGKIADIFADRGITEAIKTVSNSDGMKKTMSLVEEDFNGLAFTNLVDFDSKYGHRNDINGYAEALNEFDAWLGDFLESMKDEDLLIITADHGCDPSTESTDHSREYTPVLAYCKGITPVDIGTRSSFSDIAKSVCDIFEIENDLSGESFAKALFKGTPGVLLSAAEDAMKNSFAPYSSYNVGAALMTDEGKIYCGTNVESAAFSPTSCAERTALVNAISNGENKFCAIAVVGGRDGIVEYGCTPCGVCRQMLYELGSKDMLVFTLGKEGQIKCRRVETLLPDGLSGCVFKK